jgi:redox-sensitive bicupin YhaK (pirin superfamily)
MTQVLEIQHAMETMEGDGARVRRLFPLPARRMNFDPFVLWDDFHISAGAGFPDHPHRGFEAITYIFSGQIRHADNLGNDSVVGPGGVQCFTAGRGLVHSEMPGGDEETHGIQMWVNLPQRLKQIAPAYQQVAASEIPEITSEGCRVRIVVGEGSPVQLQTAVGYLDVQMEADVSYVHVIPAEHQGFVYVVSGEVELSGDSLPEGSAGYFTGSQLELVAITNSRLMICHGMPHGEPIHQHGPFVD